MQALQREMFEETCINIAGAAISLLDDRGTGKSQKYLHDTDETVKCNMKFYTYRIAFNLPAVAIPARPSIEFPAIKWIDITDLAAVHVTPPSASLFNRLGIL